MWFPCKSMYIINIIVPVLDLGQVSSWKAVPVRLSRIGLEMPNMGAGPRRFPERRLADLMSWEIIVRIMNRHALEVIYSSVGLKSRVRTRGHLGAKAKWLRCLCAMFWQFLECGSQLFNSRNLRACKWSRANVMFHLQSCFMVEGGIPHNSGRCFADQREWMRWTKSVLPRNEEATFQRETGMSRHVFDTNFCMSSI